MIVTYSLHAIGSNIIWENIARRPIQFRCGCTLQLMSPCMRLINAIPWIFMMPHERRAMVHLCSTDGAGTTFCGKFE